MSDVDLHREGLVFNSIDPPVFFMPILFDGFMLLLHICLFVNSTAL